MKRAFAVFPHFLYLLPLFFVLHGYAQNTAAVSAADFWALCGEYVLASACLFMVGWALFRKRGKAAVFAFALMAFHLFFGPVHDLLKSIRPDFFLARYAVLLPLIFVLLIVLIVYLTRTKRSFPRLSLYLNLLFLVLIAIDLPVAMKTPATNAKLTMLKPCDTCAKPDVWFIIADSYADSASLSQAFGFNNGAFQQALRKRGFHVVNSRANYNFTQYAVASLFTMNYLTGIDRRNSSTSDINTCYAAINQNELLSFFQQSGYAIRNFSLFNLANQPASVQYKFVPLGKRLISAHTFLQRLRRDLGYHLSVTLKLKSFVQESAFYLREGNRLLLSRLQEEINTGAQQPRFVFTHLEMPHYPYYYDSLGRERPLAFFTSGAETNEGAYLEYLTYGNRIYLKLMDSILARAKTPPVIVFMSDHGFREFAHDRPENKKFYFMNFNSVYLPNGDYGGFYEGISGVNQFRVIMNSVFGQRLPMLKDSSSLVVD